MVRAPVIPCDRLSDRSRSQAVPAAGSVAAEVTGHAGWPRRGLGLVAGLLIVTAAGGCGKDPEVRAVLLTKEVDAALGQQKWELAEKKSQEILSLGKLSDVSRDQAKLKLDQSRSEQLARVQYQKFVGYVNTEYDNAIGAYRDMPESSYYRQQAKADYDKIRPSYIDDHLGRAQSALGGGRCDDVKAQLQLVLDVDPQNGKAIDIGKKPCGKKP